MHEADSDRDADLQVQAELRRTARPASPQHDAAILAAAQSTAETIRSKAKPRRWQLPASLAASVVCAGVWLAWVSQSPPPVVDSLRGSGAGETIVALTPSDGAAVETVPPEFGWQGPEIAECTIEIRDSQAIVLWRSAPADVTSLTLPQDARAALSAPGVYYWRVECRSGAEAVIGGPFRFDLRRAKP